MIHCPIFISSADSYSDLWPIFFDMFHKYWPEFDGNIYLNTELKTYKHDSLNIICTQVGEYSSFGKTFRAGLDKVESDVVMLIMIDYLFMGDVNVEKLNEYFLFFKINNLDSLCLTHQGYPNIKHSNHPELVNILPPAPHIMFSFQIAFWKNAMLREMALPHENPWSSEWYGTLRAERMGIKLASISNKKFNPIPYDLAGCLHKGKWLKDAVDHLNRINYQVDFDRRGDFVEPSRSIKTRLKVKLMLVKDGLKGSYWDLAKR